jgi:hypothetical protein
MNFQDIAVSVLLLVGSFFTLVGAIGLARLPDFFMRLHGPTKATTLGVGGVLLAAIVQAGLRLRLASKAPLPDTENATHAVEGDDRDRSRTMPESYGLTVRQDTDGSVTADH